jgi:hypothetical protein
MKKRKLIIAGICLVVYSAFYLNVRSNHYLIHRKTWAGGWNRHWVQAGELIDGPMAFMAIGMLAEEKGQDFDSAEKQVTKAIRKAERKQAALGVLFFPLRVAETTFCFCVDLKD